MAFAVSRSLEAELSKALAAVERPVDGQKTRRGASGHGALSDGSRSR